MESIKIDCGAKEDHERHISSDTISSTPNYAAMVFAYLTITEPDSIYQLPKAGSENQTS